MMRPRVLLTRRWPAEVEAHLAGLYDLTRNEADVPMCTEDLAEACRVYDAICPTVTDRIDAKVLARPLRVRILGNFGVGTNHIDSEAAKAAGLVVTNTPDVLTDATADIAMTLLLMIARRAGEGERLLRAGRWEGWNPTQLMGGQLSGKTLGLIGFGRIAQATARRAAHGFGMRILYHGRRRAPAEVEAETGAAYVETVEALLPEVDFLSIHTPGGATTHHLLDAQRLSLLRPHARIVNTARGTVIDEAALADALAQGRLAGAGLDVYEAEPQVHPRLLDLENVVLLPHLGSATVETRVAMGMRVAANLDAFFEGRNPPDRVA
ncbi:D-glycerate dehydrogenase [Sphingosinicella sp. CPCC 101087]|uniref:2-hydroxyacid dehydrogenase n=1 Tax=Sphingosinicella sp. CPCC 101087 TaxID=2497754 RepID=UPI00101DD91E|nr:D-glycerate dehydrogenase [Sphingosinicella sp. CPCC 101087]